MLLVSERSVFSVQVFEPWFHVPISEQSPPDEDIVNGPTGPVLIPSISPKPFPVAVFPVNTCSDELSSK